MANTQNLLEYVRHFVVFPSGSSDDKYLHSEIDRYLAMPELKQRLQYALENEGLDLTEAAVARSILEALSNSLPSDDLSGDEVDE